MVSVAPAQQGAHAVALLAAGWPFPWLITQLISRPCLHVLTLGPGRHAYSFLLVLQTSSQTPKPPPGPINRRSLLGERMHGICFLGRTCVWSGAFGAISDSAPRGEGIRPLCCAAATAARCLLALCRRAARHN